MKRSKKQLKIADQIIKYGLAAIFLFTPLILTPWTYELFEFNKMVFVYLMTVIVCFSWIYKMVLARKVIFRPSFWDLPLITFLAVQAAGTIFSLNPHTSFWGYYTRSHGGLASSIAYALLYWAMVSNLGPKVTKGLTKLLFLSGLLVAGYGIMERFGVDKNYWQPDVQNRVFSTLGQPNWLAAWLMMVALLPFGLFEKKKKKLPLLWLTYFIFVLCLLFTKSRSGLLALPIGWVGFWSLIYRPWTKKGQKEIKKEKKVLIWLTIATLVLGLLIKNPYRDSLFAKVGRQPEETLPPGIHISESGNIRQVVWKGAWEIFRSAPLTGTGTETFAYSYYQHRPVEHNLLSEWDYLYNKAHNEYLNLLANNGILGLATYLGLVVSYLIWVFKKKPDWLLASLTIGFLSLQITNFFGFSVVATGLLFFLFPALSFCLNSPEPKPVKTTLPTKAVSWTVFGAGFLLILRLTQIWNADVWLARSDENLQDGLTYLAQQNIQKAIKLRPQESLFRDRHALIISQLALQAHQQDKTGLATELAQLAITESEKTISLNPYHLNYWKNQARVYLNLAEIEPTYLLKAAESLQQSLLLAPTDAKIYYNLSLIYNQLEQKQLAIETLEETIELKPNYKQARVALAYFYHLRKNDDLAVAQLEYIIQEIDPTDTSIQQRIEEWR